MRWARCRCKGLSGPEGPGKTGGSLGFPSGCGQPINAGDFLFAMAHPGAENLTANDAISCRIPARENDHGHPTGPCSASAQTDVLIEVFAAWRGVRPDLLAGYTSGSNPLLTRDAKRHLCHNAARPPTPGDRCSDPCTGRQSTNQQLLESVMSGSSSNEIEPSPGTGTPRKSKTRRSWRAKILLLFGSSTL
jgi:hypothetical protein